MLLKTKSVSDIIKCVRNPIPVIVLLFANLLILLKGAAKSNFTSIFYMQAKFIFLKFFLRLILEFFDFYSERYLHFFFPLFIVFPFTFFKKI